MSARLKEKVVIVTGGTRGMGEAVVRLAVHEGARVVFGGRDTVRGEAICSELGPNAMFYVMTRRVKRTGARSSKPPSTPSAVSTDSSTMRE